MNVVRHRLLLRSLAWLLPILIGACQYVQPTKPAEPLQWPTLDSTNAQPLKIDSQRSVIQLKVYRDGLLARLGHNHIIVASGITGTVYRREPMQNSGFMLGFPVAAMAIDRPADRRRAGDDFPGEIPEAHIKGTRENMLGPQLLQAEQYPQVELRSLGMEGRSPMVWRVAVKVRDHISELRVPVQIRMEGTQLIAQGAVKLSQTGLGLTQFCVLGGKLCVRDEIDAEFYLIASPS